jgi:hypothetical protein
VVPTTNSKPQNDLCRGVCRAMARIAYPRSLNRCRSNFILISARPSGIRKPTTSLAYVLKLCDWMVEEPASPFASAYFQDLDSTVKEISSSTGRVATNQPKDLFDFITWRARLDQASMNIDNVFNTIDPAPAARFDARYRNLALE